MKKTISPRTTGLVTATAAALLAAVGSDADSKPVRPLPKDADQPAPMVAKDPPPKQPDPVDPNIDPAVKSQQDYFKQKLDSLGRRLETQRQAIHKNSKYFMGMLEEERERKSILVDKKDAVKFAQYEKEIAKYIPDLDSSDHNNKRNPAMAALKAKGIGALHQLEAALKNADLKLSLEGKRRLETLIGEIYGRPNQQFDAIERLGKLGLQASRLEARFARLGNWDAHVKIGTEQQMTQMRADLAAIKATVDDTLPLLTAALADKNNPEFTKDGNLRLQRKVIGALRDIDVPKGMAALRKALEDELENKNGEVDRKTALIEAFASLRERGSPATPELLAALEDKSAPVRFEAIKALGSTGAEEGVVAALCTRLRNDPEAGNRAAAADSLRQLGLAAKAAAPDLIAALTKDNAYVAQAAVKALGYTGSEKDVVTALGGMLTHKEASLRKAAAEALAWHGTKAKEALPKLITALTDEDVSVRLAATKALRDVGIVAGIAEKGVGAALGRAVEDKDRDVRWNALLALSGSGTAAKEAAPVLLKACDEKQEADTNIRQWALWALRNIESPDEKIIAGVTKALGDTDTEGVRHAAIVLFNYGSKARSSAKELGVALKAHSVIEATSTQIVDAMRSIGPEQEIISALGAALHDKNQTMSAKWRALSTLDAFGPKAAKALPDLKTALSGSDDPTFTLGITNTIKNVQPIVDKKEQPKKKEGSAGKHGWRERLNDEDPQIRAHAEAQRLESRQARVPKNTPYKRG